MNILFSKGKEDTKKGFSDGKWLVFLFLKILL